MCQINRVSRLIFLLLAVCVGPATSQQVTGNLVGRVVTETEDVLPDANLTIQGESLQGQRGTTTNDEGYFQVLSLPVGVYTVRASHTAYQTVTHERVTIKLGRTTNLGKIQLQPQSVQLEPIAVSAERPLIDPTSTTLGANLESAALSVLPLQRDITSAAALLPQANSGGHPDDGVNIGGLSGWDNAFYIDGINVTDPQVGNVGTSLPYNFIREIEVKTGGYEAEFGRSLGGIINAVTPSGSNHFYGQVFGFLTSSGLTGQEKGTAGGLSEGAFSIYDVGLTVGGPLAKDRLWFHGAYNPEITTRDISITGLGVHEDKATTHRFAGKLTWQASSKTNLVLTAFGDPLTRNSVGSTYIGQMPDPNDIVDLDTSLGKIRRGGLSFSLRGRHTLSSQLFLEASVARLTNRWDDAPRDPSGMREPFYGDFIEGVWSGGYGRRIEMDIQRTSADLSTTFVSRRHTLKVGIQHELNEVDFLFANQLTGKTGQEPSVFVRPGPDFYIGIFSDWGGVVGNRVWSLFGQDAWRITDRLTLNLGLRWDSQTYQAAGNDIQTISNAYQPRVGFVYRPDSTSPQRIFGSFGRFYQQTVTDFLWIHVPSTYITFLYPGDPRTNPVPIDTLGTTLGSTNNTVPGLDGQYHDEFTLGYERVFANQLKLGIRAIRRDLREAIDSSIDQVSREPIWGNPGKGALAAVPRPKRTYHAVEVTAEKTKRDRYRIGASYVWSRNKGNITATFSDENLGMPNAVGLYQERSQNLYGPLPNDRTHVFKLHGSFILGRGLTIGTAATVQSGTPLSNLGLGVFESQTIHLSPRGTAGRSPATWDWDLRVVYDLSALTKGKEVKPRLVTDIHNLFSRRKATIIDQVHYFDLDPDRNPVGENPAYLEPTHYQAPMSARLGVEIDF